MLGIHEISSGEDHPADGQCGSKKSTTVVTVDVYTLTAKHNLHHPPIPYFKNIKSL